MAAAPGFIAYLGIPDEIPAGGGAPADRGDGARRANGHGTVALRHLLLISTSPEEWRAGKGQQPRRRHRRAGGCDGKGSRSSARPEPPLSSRRRIGSARTRDRPRPARGGAAHDRASCCSSAIGDSRCSPATTHASTSAKRVGIHEALSEAGIDPAKVPEILRPRRRERGSSGGARSAPAEAAAHRAWSPSTTALARCSASRPGATKGLKFRRNSASSASTTGPISITSSRR